MAKKIISEKSFAEFNVISDRVGVKLANGYRFPYLSTLFFRNFCIASDTLLSFLS